MEGLVTAAVLVFVYEARPEMVKNIKAEGSGEGRFSFKATIAVLAAAAVIIGGGLSLLASANPDGLEWALFGNAEEGYSENMGLDEENFGADSPLAEKAESVQNKTSFLPDYAFASDSESPAGTSVSGIAGIAMVAVAAVAVCLAGGFFRKKKKAEAAGK